jgi:hypothetical protein
MTLVELVVAGAAAAVLMLGLMSCFLIAGRALDEDQIAPARQIKTGRSLEGVLADLRDAIAFSERTASAVTFQVPDRDGDTLAETIRYSWSGTAGDPLMMEYNGGDPAQLVADVKQFDLAYTSRTMTGTGFTKGVFPPERTVLFVSGGTFIIQEPGGEVVVTPTTEETARIALIESWLNMVELIHSTQSQADFDSAVADANVVYVSQEVSDTDLGTKLVNASIGVVNENWSLIDEFGFATSGGLLVGAPTLDVDMSHYITAVFATNPVSPYLAVESHQGIITPVAPGLEAVGTWATMPYTGMPALMVLQVGAELVGGGSAAGARVQIPWGSGPGATPVALDSLSEDAKTIMDRAIEWAADPSLIVVPEIYVHDITMGWRLQGNSYYGQATIEVREDGGGGIAGALVRGEWSGVVSSIDLGTTGSDGTVMLESPGKKDGGTYTFTVTDITLGGYSYNSSLNWETSDWITAP